MARLHMHTQTFWPSNCSLVKETYVDNSRETKQRSRRLRINTDAEPGGLILIAQVETHGIQSRHRIRNGRPQAEVGLVYTRISRQWQRQSQRRHRIRPWGCMESVSLSQFQ